MPPRFERSDQILGEGYISLNRQMARGRAWNEPADATMHDDMHGKGKQRRGARQMARRAQWDHPDLVQHADRKASKATQGSGATDLVPPTQFMVAIGLGSGPRARPGVDTEGWGLRLVCRCGFVVSCAAWWCGALFRNAKATRPGAVCPSRPVPPRHHAVPIFTAHGPLRPKPPAARLTSFIVFLPSLLVFFTHIKFWRRATDRSTCSILPPKLSWALSRPAAPAAVGDILDWQPHGCSYIPSDFGCVILSY